VKKKKKKKRNAEGRLRSKEAWFDAGTAAFERVFQGEFRRRLADEHKPITADLAVLGLEDVEQLESILTATKSLQWGSVRGFLEILRTWDKERGPAPSWWQFVEVIWGRQRRNEALQQAFTKWREAVADRFPAK